MKLQTSNFAGGLRVRDDKQKNNWTKKGRGQSHVTYFLMLEPLYYLSSAWSYKRQVLQKHWQ